MSAGTPKRTYQDESGPYVLPNDTLEHTRLDGQSNAFFKVMGRTFHTPAQHPKRILDVGCGTGIVTVQLARKFPEAEVIGIDIAPVPVHLHGELPNLKYVQGDISVLAGNDQEGFGHGTFDLVFARFLICAITDWPNHVKRMADLVAPGGWLEMQDFSYDFYAGPNRTDFAEGTNMALTWEWRHTYVKACKAGGLDVTCGSHLASWLEAAGAVNVKDQLYKIPPLGPPSADGYDEAEISRRRQTQAELIEKVCSRQYSPEAVAKLKEDMLADFMKFKDGDWVAMHVVTGQAPERL